MIAEAGTMQYITATQHLFCNSKNSNLTLCKSQDLFSLVPWSSQSQMFITGLSQVC